MKIDLKTNRKFWGIANNIGYTKSDVEELVFEVLNQRTSIVRELNTTEYFKVLDYMQAIQIAKYPLGIAKISDFEKGEKQRKKFFSICHELNWKLPNGQLDYPRINGWLKAKGYLHKAINEYKYADLPKLISQLENLLKP